MASTALAIASIVVSAVGAGVSAYGQSQSAKMQTSIADFNAKQQESNSRTQLLSMQVQSALKEQETQANFALRSSEASARLSNAKGIENQALTQDAIDRLNASKRREDFSRMQGQQRAQIAASGVVESTGTPLDLLAETAAKIQQDASEQQYHSELQRRTLFSEASQERLGGQLALTGATLNRNSGLAAAALNANTAQAQYLAGIRGAEITRLTGGAQAQALRYQSAATLFSGVSNAASSSYNLSRNIPTYKVG